MQHRLNDVARSRRLNEAAFIEYAISHSTRYSIIPSHDGNHATATVSTWHVDSLVEAYKQSTESRMTKDYTKVADMPVERVLELVIQRNYLKDMLQTAVDACDTHTVHTPVWVVEAKKLLASIE